MPQYPLLTVPVLRALKEQQVTDTTSPYYGEIIKLDENGTITRGSLERFLKIVGPMFDEIRGLTAYLPNMVDVDTIDSSFLPQLGALVGIEVDTTLSVDQQREQIRTAVPLYRRKGTLPGMELVGYFATGITPEAYEFVHNILWTNMVPWTTHLGFSTVTSLGVSIDKVYVIDTQGFEAGINVLLENYRGEREILDVIAIGVDVIDGVDNYYVQLGSAPSIALQEGDDIARIVEDYTEYWSSGDVIEPWGLVAMSEGRALTRIGLPGDPVGHIYDETYFDVLKTYAGAALGDALSPTAASSASNLMENGSWIANQSSPQDLPQEWVFALDDAKAVRYVRVKADFGLYRFEIAHSDDGINYFFVEEFTYGTPDRFVADFTLDAATQTTRLKRGPVTLTDPPPNLSQVDNEATAGSLSVPLLPGATSMINLGFTQGDWFSVVSGNIKEVFQAVDVIDALVVFEPACASRFPIGSAVNRVEVTAVGSYATYVDIDAINGLVTNLTLANGRYLMDGYAAKPSPAKLPWQIYRIEREVDPHRYWKVRVLSTWGRPAAIQAINMSEIDWSLTFYTCDKLGMFFPLPCEPAPQLTCVVPEPCGCSAPVWLTLPHIEDGVEFRAFPVLPHCNPCVTEVGDEEKPCGYEDYEYQFDWLGDGNVTAWLTYDPLGFAHTISPMPLVPFFVRVRVRKVSDHTCYSGWHSQFIPVVVVGP